MAKNTSVLLGDHFEEFINQKVISGQFTSASEVIRSALRLFEYEELKKNLVINDLVKGENSGFSLNFDREKFKDELQKKHAG